MGLLDILVGNLAIGAALLLLAIALSRLTKRPALVHGICLLIMLKLLTPPLFRVDISLPQLVDSSTREAPAIPDVAFAPVPEGAWLDAAPPAVAEVPVLREAADPAPDLLLLILLGLWALGSLIVITNAVARGLRFKKLVRHAGTPPPAITERLAELAGEMGIRHPPQPAIIPGRLPPMLWAPPGGAKLLLPKRLVDELGSRELDCLLAHELAHYRRGDHLVRWIELIALAVHWWNPIVWLARRTLRDAEESCCDAWVLWVLPEHSRDYADSLLSTVDFLADTKVALPPAASGVGTTQNLRRRLTMIMLETTPRRLTRLTKILVLGCGAMLLPALPSLAQDQAQHERHITEIHKQLAEFEAQQRALDKFRAEIDRLEHEIQALREDGDLAHAKKLEAKLRTLAERNANVARHARNLKQHELPHARSLDDHLTALRDRIKEAKNLGKADQARALLETLKMLEAQKAAQEKMRVEDMLRMKGFHKLQAENEQLNRRLAEERQKNSDERRREEIQERMREWAKRATAHSQNPLARIAEQQLVQELQVLHKTMEVLRAHGLNDAAADLEKAAQAIAKRMHTAQQQHKNVTHLDMARQKLEAERRQFNRQQTHNTDQSDRIRRLELRMEEMASTIAALKAELAKSRRKL